MGIVRHPLIGAPTGKIGDYIYRLRYGKIVVYKVPENFKKSKSKASKANRSRFTPMSQFASIVCTFQELKVIWEDFKELKAHSAYHKVEMANARSLDSKRPSMRNFIVPGFGFGVEHKSGAINKKKVSIVVKIQTTIVEDISLIRGFNVIIIICFYDPVDKKGEYLKFYPIRRRITKWKYGKPFEIKYEFSKEEGGILSEYKKCIIYYAMVPWDENDYMLGYSESNSLELDISEKEAEQK